MTEYSSHQGPPAAASIRAPGQDRVTTHRAYPFDPLIPLSTNTCETYAFLIPGAGDSITSFLDFACAIERSLSLYGLQPRGIQAGESPFGSIEEAAECNLDAINKLRIRSPIHLIGHSHGGQVAFEMARILQQRGLAVASLSIIDSEPPMAADADGRTFTFPEVRQEFVRAFELRYERRLGIDGATLAGDEFCFLDCLHKTLSGADLIPRKTSAEILRGPFNTFSAAIRSKYKPASPYSSSVRLVLVRDSTLNEQEDDARRRNTISAWRLAAPGLEVTHGPGNHFSLLTRQHVQWLADWWQGSAVPPLEAARGPVRAEVF